MYTVGQTYASTYMAVGQQIKIDKKKVSYQAIAVVAGIDVYGEVVAMLTNPGSIKIE